MTQERRGVQEGDAGRGNFDMMDMSLGCLSGHEIVSCMVQWTLDGKDPEVPTVCYSSTRQE